jgi:hypothetical protein
MTGVINRFEQYGANVILSTEGTNSISFDNNGGITLIINNVWPVRPGELKSLSQLVTDVIDRTRYSISFDVANVYGANEADPTSPLYNVKRITAITSVYADLPNKKQVTDDIRTGPGCTN